MSAPKHVQIVLPKGALGGWAVLVDALRQAEDKTGLHMVFGGLIEQITEQAIRPPEPTGMGAVVEDDEGRTWVRAASHMPNCNDWHLASGLGEFTPGRTRYSEIAAVRVLSEGVTP